MKELLFTSISLVVLLGCQDGNTKHEARDNTDKSVHIPIDNHHVPIIDTCFHCDCNK